ncbi:MAG: XRE family transcriptional regulator [Gammaproteobacteria bacterium]|nr:MAG: XRE family transcriptional regulator [Gammaproteobacteria bacterium]
MCNQQSVQKRSAVVFPRNRKILAQLGENIRLAIKRRGFTQTLISQRTGLSRLTIRRIERGDAGVSLGHYVAVLSVLGLADDIAKVANDDELGRKLQDIKLAGTRDER